MNASFNICFSDNNLTILRNIFQDEKELIILNDFRDPGIEEDGDPDR